MGTVKSLPKAGIVSTGPTNFCPGGNVVLNDTITGSYIYQWKMDGVAVAGATNSVTLPGDVDDAATIPGHTFIVKNMTVGNVSVFATHDTIIRNKLLLY